MAPRLPCADRNPLQASQVDFRIKGFVEPQSEAAPFNRMLDDGVYVFKVLDPGFSERQVMTDDLVFVKRGIVPESGKLAVFEDGTIDCYYGQRNVMGKVVGMFRGMGGGAC